MKDIKELVAAFEEVCREQQKVEEPTKKKPSKGQKEKAEYLLVRISVVFKEVKC